MAPQVVSFGRLPERDFVTQEGVTEAVLSAERIRAPSRYGEYSEHFFASDSLAGSDNYLDLAGRITVRARGMEAGSEPQHRTKVNLSEGSDDLGG